MVMFSERMRPEVMQPFWDALVRGEFITQAAESVGTYRVKGKRWMAASGGLRPRRGRNLKGRCLTFAEREEIALGRAAGESIRCIGRRLGRSPSRSPASYGATRIAGAATGQVAPALATKIQTLPDTLRRSLTWD